MVSLYCHIIRVAEAKWFFVTSKKKYLVHSWVTSACHSNQNWINTSFTAASLHFHLPSCVDATKHRNTSSRGWTRNVIFFFCCFYLCLSVSFSCALVGASDPCLVSYTEGLQAWREMTLRGFHSAVLWRNFALLFLPTRRRTLMDLTLAQTGDTFGSGQG